MRTVVRTVWFSISLAILPLPGWAQGISSSADGGSIASSSSIERRDLQRQRRERTPSAPGAAVTPPSSETFVRLTPSFTLNDAATGVGLGAQVVSAPSSGLGYFVLRPSYRQSRPRAEDGHRNGLGIGADLQVTADDNRFGQFIISGDYTRVMDSYQLGLATIEFDRSLGDLTFIGTASVGRLTPEAADGVSDIIPALEVDFAPSGTSLRVITAYTFKNDIDGEDDYEAGLRFSTSDRTAVRVALGKGGRVTAGVVMTVKKEKKAEPKQ